ncbi:DUF2147 domain-containing protein [Paraburkholderia adhaesiva]|uniref:DUF2147 domain-containing protein n=1 Tax=Paraburkholderia adhaesiva TaxID=2883244 RepID=UPI001F3FD5E6|nr:DUF2147 domain-containing protein [Paraburkholderia adhaesiva]
MNRITGRTAAFAARAATQLALASALLGGAIAAHAQTTTPVGVWHTIDDQTGKPKAVVQISDDGNGQLSGKVVNGLDPNAKPDRKCTACTDERKDQPIIGMTIIDGMQKTGDGWDNGHILDPENGKVYRCKMHLEDGGKKLVVRGYLGISLLGRSQTWTREQ